MLEVCAQGVCGVVVDGVFGICSNGVVGSSSDDSEDVDVDGGISGVMVVFGVCGSDGDIAVVSFDVGSGVLLLLMLMLLTFVFGVGSSGGSMRGGFAGVVVVVVVLAVLFLWNRFLLSCINLFTFALRLDSVDVFVAARVVVVGCVGGGEVVVVREGVVVSVVSVSVSLSSARIRLSACMML